MATTIADLSNAPNGDGLLKKVYLSKDKRAKKNGTGLRKTVFGPVHDCPRCKK